MAKLSVGRSVSIAYLQDALNYAIASVGGIDASGRESAFRQRELGTAPSGRRRPRLITSAEWRHRAREALRRTGLRVTPRLRGEQLIKYIDRVAHAAGWDAYTARRFDQFDPRVYDLNHAEKLPNRKLRRRRQ